MILAFLVTFIVALLFTFFSFIFIEGDLQTKQGTFQRARPIFLLIIAFTAWFASIGLLITPDTYTTAYPASNIIQITSSGNIITMYPAYNTTTQTNVPFPTNSFYEYMAFAGAMATIDIIILIIYMLRFGLKEFKTEMDELARVKK